MTIHISLGSGAGTLKDVRKKVWFPLDQIDLYRWFLEGGYLVVPESRLPTLDLQLKLGEPPVSPEYKEQPSDGKPWRNLKGSVRTIVPRTSSFSPPSTEDWTKSPSALDPATVSDEWYDFVPPSLSGLSLSDDEPCEPEPEPPESPF